MPSTYAHYRIGSKKYSWRVGKKSSGGISGVVPDWFARTGYSILF